MAEKKNGLALTLISTFAIIAIVLGLFVYTMTTPRMMSEKELVNNGARPFEKPVELKPFTLLDHNGAAFTQDSVKGQWTLLFFGFSHCGGFCPTTLAMLNQLHGQLEADIAENTQVVMVTVDPQRDTPQVLADYVTQFNQDFIGVTGEFLPIKLLSDQFYIAFQKETGVQAGEAYEVAHGEQIVLINPEGQYQGFFKPPFTLARLKTTYQSMVITYQRKH